MKIGGHTLGTDWKSSPLLDYGKQKGTG